MAAASREMGFTKSNERRSSSLYSSSRSMLTVMLSAGAIVLGGGGGGWAVTLECWWWWWWCWLVLDQVVCGVWFAGFALMYSNADLFCITMSQVG